LQQPFSRFKEAVSGRKKEGGRDEIFRQFPLIMLFKPIGFIDK
jgi:hypothetical protein